MTDNAVVHSLSTTFQMADPVVDGSEDRRGGVYD